MSLRLSEFNWEQTQELAQRYGLDKSNPPLELEHLKSLQQIVGGHPYLLNLALCHLVTQDNDVEKLLRDATTETGIYRNHLRGHLAALNQYPELRNVYQKLVRASDPLQLDAIAAYKLESMGLVKLQGNEASPLCKLYRLYFGERL